MKVVEASEDHIDWIVRHRLEMFRSMGWTDEELEKTSPFVRRFLLNSWDENLRCFLALIEDDVVGGCAIGIGATLPTYKNPSGKSASIHNLYVEPAFRKLGIGAALVGYALDVCRSEGIRRVTLQATEMGLRIYENEGFVKVENHYKLNLA
ncbi:MAG: GNAT family N-acetyltransferase [Candidatus Thorarchaeota archaeon]